MDKQCQLESAEDYKILSQSSCTTLDGVDDAAQFRGVQKAFDTIGIEADDQMQARDGRGARGYMVVWWSERLYRLAPAYAAEIM